MAERSPLPDLDQDDDEGTPRWVIVSGAVAVALLLLFVATHLAGGGFGNHFGGH